MLSSPGNVSTQKLAVALKAIANEGGMKKKDVLKEFIGHYDEEEQEEIISLIKEEKANIIRDLLIYSNHLALSIMTTEFLTININYTLK